MENILIPVLPFRFHICLLKKMLQPAIPGVSWSLANSQPLNREFCVYTQVFAPTPQSHVWQSSDRSPQAGHGHSYTPLLYMTPISLQW